MLPTKDSVNKPIENEARLDIERENYDPWYDGVLKNARILKKITDSASISLHVIVCRVSNQKIRIWDRNDISDLLDENVSSFFVWRHGAAARKKRFMN